MITIEAQFSGDQLSAALKDDDEELYYFLQDLEGTNLVPAMEYADDPVREDIADWLEEQAQAIRAEIGT